MRITFPLGTLLMPYFAITSSCFGQGEIFVSNAGRDSAEGTSPQTALSTLSAAVKKAKPGTTITLLPGWYDGGVKLKAGEKGKPIIVRTARRGRVFVGNVERLTHWRQPEGMVYAHAVSLDAPPGTVTESDTLKVLRPMPKPADVEELAGSFTYDAATKLLYVHPTDSAGVAHHAYVPATEGERDGVEMANHTVVDGLVMTGFSGAAIRMSACTDATVENCVLYGNGYGIYMNGGTNCLVRNNEVWGSTSTYVEASQIMATGGYVPIDGVRVEGNIIHDSRMIGLRFYSGQAGNGTWRGNLIYNNSFGGFYKVNTVTGDLVAERNMVFNNAGGDLDAPLMRHNSIGQYLATPHGRPGDLDLDVAKFRKDPKFADAAYHDYRLQRDSSARGRAPDGTDLGAFSYDDSVRYVRPDGDDAADGASEASAWKTLSHATAALQSGQTLYIAPGEWKEPIVLKNLKAAADKPTRIRVKGKGQATFPAVRIEGSAHLHLEDIRVTGSAHDGMAITGSERIRLTRCATYRNGKAGVTLATTTDFELDHCAVTGNRIVGIEIAPSCSDIAVISSLVAGNGGTQISLAASIPGFYSEFNAFGTESASLGRVGERAAKDLSEWRTVAGSDRKSVMDVSGVEGATRGDFRIAAGTAMSYSGRFGRAVGPGSLHHARVVPRDPIERIEVISTTPSSANITWWTPGRICGTAIQWGLTPACEHRSDLGSEAETFHVASVVGLQPKTLYHFRVGFRDGDKANADGQPTMRWSEINTFVTAADELEARTLYVALDGNDQHNGLTPQSGWRTLRKAAREARAGDTVIIAPGRYPGVLRPLQTGTGPDRRITFRAEKPLTVYIDGGRQGDASGLANAIEVNGKAWLTFENLAVEKTSMSDYRSIGQGQGLAGLVRCHGGSMIDFNSVLADCRFGYCPGFNFSHGGRTPGITNPTYASKVTDSVVLSAWDALGIDHAAAPVIWEHSLAYISWIGTFQVGAPVEGGPSKVLRVRNSVFHDRSAQKRRGASIYGGKPLAVDADYNAYFWMPADHSNGACPIYATHNFPGDPVANKPPLETWKVGLAAWRDYSGQDSKSIEIFMATWQGPASYHGQGLYPGTDRLNHERAGSSLPPVEIDDFVPPLNSRLRRRGENGADIGPRWEKWSKKGPVARLETW